MISLKVLIMSDTHGDTSFWEYINDFLSKADFVIHAGDVLYHGPRNPLPAGYNPAKLAELINNSKPFFISKGNCDADVDQLVIKFPISSPYLLLYVNSLKILVTHGENKNEDDLFNLTELFDVDLLIFGHIHTPVLKERNKRIILNPGSPSLPKTEYKSVAFLDEEKVSIIDIISKKEIFSLYLYK